MGDPDSGIEQAWNAALLLLQAVLLVVAVLLLLLLARRTVGGMPLFCWSVAPPAIFLFSYYHCFTPLYAGSIAKNQD